jgi:hypothetical protein
VQVRIREAGVGLVGVAEAERGGQGGQGSGRDFRVVLIKEGKAKTGRYFTRQAVEDVARLAEGARAFADHVTPEEYAQRPVRSVRDVVGWYSDVMAEEVEDPHPPSAVSPRGRGETVGRKRLQVVGTLHITEANEWLACLVREALAAGQRDVIGLSIDSMAVIRVGEAPE